MNEKHSAVRIVYSDEVGQQDSRPVAWHCKFDGAEMGTKSFYSVHWCNEKPRADVLPGVGHPPHIHKENEIIMLIGTDPNNPDDLGGEVTLSVGAEMTPLHINKCCTIVIPGGTPHGNYSVVETHRPWLFVQVQEAAPRTEKFLWNYLTPEQVASIPHIERWVDTGFDDED